MGLFQKKPDPIDQRARDLNSEIAKLESEIRKLNKQCSDTNRIPRFRSANSPATKPAPPAPVAAASEPVFEAVNQTPVKADPIAPTPAHFNELGVRKFDLAARPRPRAPGSPCLKAINKFFYHNFILILIHRRKTESEACLFFQLFL